ncbi:MULTISPECIES: amino acid ABC transporter permease [unclassified Romboutsia]|uniref:amino acid ABC transporter permease n=1 Tax=unclassified Romboutsia TaxID=2626894 RepID=UPI0008213E40|nr:MULTISPECIES: amino acid ABC transporter permease [unclassified Romboutsia]SCI11994.1 Arginine transport system permease protein ArtQ [uncultured Clostridium sp.]
MVSLELLKKSLPSLLSGLGVTVKIAFFAIIIACVIGLIFGILSISKYKIISGIAFIYTTIIRGTPLMIQAMFIFFGLGQFLGIRFNPVSAGIWILALNSGAYLSEIFRGGIQAVDIGQMEAARSLGMPTSMAMRKVILPQAIKIMIPSLMNQFIIAIKDTSILSVISIRELMQSGQIIVGTTYKAFEIYGIVAIMYLVLITLLMWASKLVERRLAS